MAENRVDFLRVELAPEMVLAALRSMPEVISAEYRDGRFYAQTFSGIAEIKFFFPQNDSKGTV